MRTFRDMLSIMHEYGSEVSDTAMPPRKSFVQKASVVRQFRRWNPTFLEWFEHVNGKWVPKLGKAGEMRRRQEARRSAATQRKKKPDSVGANSTAGCDNDCNSASHNPTDALSEVSADLGDSTHTGISI
jgi:hypothetical protein